MGEKISMLGLIMSFPPYLGFAMVQFPLHGKCLKRGADVSVGHKMFAHMGPKA